MRRACTTLATILLGGSMLAGCTLIPGYHRPALPVQDSYPAAFATTPAATGGTSVDQIDWRAFFADPLLRDLIRLALADNRDLRVAAGNVLTAEASFRVQRSSLLPTVDATAGAEFEHEPSAASSGFGALNINAYSLGIGTASYELDVFGRLRSLTRQAREQFLSQVETRRSVQISLIAQLAETYLSYRADGEAIRVSVDTARAQQHSYDLRVLTLQQGSGTALDVAQAESSLRTAQASLAQYQRQQALDYDNIVLLVGAPLTADLHRRLLADDAGLDQIPPFPPLPAGLPSDLLTRRPDIRAAEHTLLAANANIGAARAAFFPSIQLTGSGGTASGTLGSLFAAGSGTFLVQPQISVPIFDFGRNFANLDIARVQKRIEIANYEHVIQMAFRDVADALAARSTYTDELSAEESLVAADQKFYDLSRMRFDAGIDNYLSVLVAQNSLFSAQLNLVQLKLAQRQNLVTLYRALGGGWSR